MIGFTLVETNSTHEGFVVAVWNNERCGLLSDSLTGGPTFFATKHAAREFVRSVELESKAVVYYVKMPAFLFYALISSAKIEQVEPLAGRVRLFTIRSSFSNN
jgi:hypothetical protein